MLTSHDLYVTRLLLMMQAMRREQHSMLSS